jgi:hypothetical protein
MERSRHTAIKVYHSKMNVTDLKEFMDKIAIGDIEIVYSKEKDGKVDGWCKDEKYALEKCKAGKLDITDRFPKVYNDKGDLVTKKTLKDTDLAKLKNAQEVAEINAQKELQKEKDELIAKLSDPAFTKAMIEKEYGVSAKLTKDKMIEEVIKLVYGE